MTLPNDCFEKFLMSTKHTTTLLDKMVTYLHTLLHKLIFNHSQMSFVPQNKYSLAW